ncbi:hypothetical protein KVT40_002020 [Elsinoe batatas]|uniref:Uncharacterized protein n=1 Tax=Elsinoe batatas TaxID=2601811 RepID=A0A8K0L5Q0_9PEZI|nr:hypothetical protein KVT40_002020 [Elsinoe batatas]
MSQVMKSISSPSLRQDTSRIKKQCRHVYFSSAAHSPQFWSAVTLWFLHFHHNALQLFHPSHLSDQRKSSMNHSGGFLPHSPPPSSVASFRQSNALPLPRSSPLKPGGSKESSFIRFVDQQILYIQRRFAKRDTRLDAGARETDEQGRSIDSGIASIKLDKLEQWQDVPGYTTFGEASRNVEELLGIIWISGTPSLQIPYLISIALLVNTMIPAFPAAPRQLFRLIGKLDHAFASLLQGRDVDTGEPLPGFSTGRKVSTTEKVRIKSLIERTRISVANVMAAGDIEDEEEEVDTEEGLEGDLVLDDVDDPEPTNDEDWDMDVAKVYDKTLVEIGDSLDGPEIGIRTEPR